MSDIEQATRHRMLIVDDEEATRLLIARIVSNDLDVEVMLAGTCEQALRLGGSYAFDAILLDLMMPGIGGFGVLKETAIRDRDLIIIRVDFVEGEEAVPVAAIFDESGLKGGLYARDAGEVDIAAQRLSGREFEIEIFNASVFQNADPNLFRVGRVDQHVSFH